MMTRGRKAALLAPLVAIALIGTIGSSASAFTGHPLVMHFGTFTSPTGVAVDANLGTVLVADGRGPETVDVFGLSGNSLPQLTGFEFGSEPAGVAVDNSNSSSRGDLYVTDVRRVEVDKFKPTSSGGYERVGRIAGFAGEVIGATVDSEGNLYVSDYNAGIHEYTPAGVELGQLTSAILQGPPQGLAVDASGDIYVSPYRSGNLVELKRSSNTSLAVSSEVEVASGGVTDVAFDRAAGRLYVDFGTSIAEYGPAGEELSRFGAGILAESLGVEVDEQTGRVYATDAGGSPPSVAVFGPYAALLPDATTEAASLVRTTSAVLNGTLNPLGVAASYYFEYGLTAAYGSTSPAPPGITAGAGSEAVEAAANVTGLMPGTTYHFRLVAVNAEGINRGEDRVFTTEPTVPTVNDQPATASAVTHRSALLAGRINTENSDTRYHFQYGTSPSYGFSTTEVDAGIPGGDKPVGPVPVSELQPGTVYHYRLVATNAVGTTDGPDLTFTTAPAIAPFVGTGAASGVTQTTAIVSGSVDTRGLDTSYQFEIGADTSYGSKAFGDAGLDPGPRTVAEDLGSLTPGTIYHYRFVAFNEDGTSYGADETFTTPGYANPAPLVQPATPPLLATPSPASLEGPAAKPTKPKHHKKKAKRKTKKRARKTRKSGRK